MKIRKGLIISIAVIAILFAGIMAYIQFSVPGESILLDEIAGIEVESGPNNRRLLEPVMRLAVAYEIAGRWKKAAIQYERVIQLRGGTVNAGISLALARNLDFSGQYEKANEIYDSLLKEQMKKEQEEVAQRKAATAFEEKSDIT